MKPSDHGRIELISGTANSEGDTSVATSGTANTKGSWVSLVASTPHEYESLFLTINRVSTVDEFMFDIAIQKPGGSTQEIIIENVISPHSRASREPFGPLKIWARIPAGSEIFMRAQRNVTGVGTMFPILYGMTQGFEGPRGGSHYVTMGADKATSRGTILNPNLVSASTYPATFTQLTASLTDDVQRVIVVVGSNGAGVLNNREMQIQIAYGVNDTVIADSLQFETNAIHDIVRPRIYDLDLFIPAGVTVQARLRSSSTADEPLDIALYGLIL